ncbi:MAG: co-chaperone GroES [Candidatus Peribacteria bacterium]|nr:co-chaperone GroES [Candidatus Peribacteria bacterium]
MILPDSKEKPHKGAVIAIGAGKILENGSRSPVDVKVGDVVYFTQYAPDEIEVNEGEDKVKYLVIKHSSLLAKE